MTLIGWLGRKTPKSIKSNSVDADEMPQNAASHQGLHFIWVYTVCSGLSVRIHTINMVYAAKTSACEFVESGPEVIKLFSTEHEICPAYKYQITNNY